MDPYVGEIRLCAFSYAPRGWALCNGALLSINQNQALFSLLGVKYGGNGQTNFALPDLRGRVACHRSVTPATPLPLASQGGTETVALTVQQMPAHNHPFNVSTQPAEFLNVGTTGNRALARSNLFDADNPGIKGDGAALYGPVTSPAHWVALSEKTCSTAGAGAAHENMQPSLVLNYIIATIGIYPPRGVVA